MDNKTLFVNKLNLNIDGLEKPEVIMQNGRSFTIIKESKYVNDDKNVGLIIDKNKKEITIKNNINRDITLLGGDKYYNKYLKYKIKYLKLKKLIE